MAEHEASRLPQPALFRAHPWHGVTMGAEAPGIVTVFVEIVPTDTVKYEIDKVSGLLKVDRPQKFSNVCPSLYGFVPQTLCDVEVAALAASRSNGSGIVGDGDPLDICVLTEKAVAHGDLLVRARPLGGFCLLDGNQADDKIVAVLDGDAVFGGMRDVDEVPPALLQRLRHYFLTYKQAPGATERVCEITATYGREQAHEVIRRSRADYLSRFG